MKPERDCLYTCWPRRDAVTRRDAVDSNGSAGATISMNIQSSSVAFEPGEEMLFVDSKSPCNVCTQARHKVAVVAMAGVKNVD